MFVKSYEKLNVNRKTAQDIFFRLKRTYKNRNLICKNSSTYFKSCVYSHEKSYIVYFNIVINFNQCDNNFKCA